MMNDYDIVSKVSVVPRGPTGGVTVFMPTEERLNSGLYSRSFLENRMCVALGGRIAEELLNGKENVTTGASNDFQQCTSVATAMVTQLGMSDAIGQRYIGGSGSSGKGPFMGRDFLSGGAPPVSQKVKMTVDKEVTRIVNGQYDRGMQLLKSNKILLDRCAEMLIEREKINGEDLVRLINEHSVQGILVPEVPQRAMAVACFVGERVPRMGLEGIGNSLATSSRSIGACMTGSSSHSVTFSSHRHESVKCCAFGNMGPPKQNPKLMVQPDTGVKFKDVAGIDECKEELQEIVEFLQNPARFVKVGAKIPKGVLLTGPPGTGKTLMAKALAGESGVPFIQASASEFIEMFVGVGASRVRDIFKTAKENAPCIVFIDEIDAIGRQRGAGMGGGNDEREQTLNQILTELDGFEGNNGVIVVAATNRADILDSALLRPGRFDRRLTVGLPDMRGREQILKVHVKNKKLGPGILLSDVAKRTTGFSGADLENLMNEAAILAVRRGLKAISMLEINDATDRVIMGLEGRSLYDNTSKKLIAYHEAGHALVGSLLPHHDEVNKVTLIPRGQAKGLTWFTPHEDQSLVSTNMMKARIAGALGGRAAEQLVFGNSLVTTGAGGDLQLVEQLCRQMVTRLGMSDFGFLVMDDGDFRGPSYSEEMASKIDDAIQNISDECYVNAYSILQKNRACLDKIADELTEYETLTGDRLRTIVREFTSIPEKTPIV